MMSDLAKLLFDPRGRVGRASYIYTQVGVLTLDYLFRLFIKHSPVTTGLAALTPEGQFALNVVSFAGAVIFYVSFVISLKRLRDMARSGWWLALVYGPGAAFAVLLWITAQTAKIYGLESLSPIEPIFMFIVRFDWLIPLLYVAILVVTYGFKLWLAAAPSQNGGASPEPAPRREASRMIPNKPFKGFGRRGA